MVRVEAFKSSTILSAFRKTGICPFNPQHVLDDVATRRPRTPTPPPTLSSSVETTPVTVRQFNAMADKITNSMSGSDHNLGPDDTTQVKKFIKGSLVAANELLQTKRDLSRTKLAEHVKNSRRVMKNYHLQTGGVLTVAEGRNMVQRKANDEVDKARRTVQRHEDQALRVAKKVWFDAAKQARALRLSGKLPRCEIIESGVGRRMLVRF